MGLKEIKEYGREVLKNLKRTQKEIELIEKAEEWFNNLSGQNKIKVYEKCKKH